MALDQLLNWIVDALFNPLAVGDDRLRAPVADGIGGDDPLGGDDEHRLVVAVAEDVDVVRAVDLGGCERRTRRRRRRGRLRLRRGRRSGRGEPAAKSCNKCAFHVSSFLIGRYPAETGRGPGLFPWYRASFAMLLGMPRLVPYHSRKCPGAPPRLSLPSKRFTKRNAARCCPCPRGSRVFTGACACRGRARGRTSSAILQRRWTGSFRST